jgi:hypothetical protein
MKLLLLKTLLQRRARDEGFTLPMVIALGLVMVLLGVISLTTANEETITAISQNSKSDALAVAEVGVARYRELLDRNRELTIFDNTIDNPEWRDDTKIRQIRQEVCNSDDININTDILSEQDVVDTQDLDNDGNVTETIGSYSLVSYDYIGSGNSGDFYRKDDNLNQDAAGNNARGILTVQGIAADDNSKAQIQVDIPLRINPDDLNNLAPALWIGNNTVTAAKLGNLTIGNGNVVIKDQATPTTDGCRNFSDADTTDGSQNLASTVTFPIPPVTTPPTIRGTVISNSRNLPPIQKIIDDVTKAGTTANAGDTAIIPGKNLFGTTTSTPYNPDNDTINCPITSKSCRYYYDLRGADRTYTNELLTDGIAKTTLLLDQNLIIDATTIPAVVPATVPPTPIKIIGSTSEAASDSNNFEIYVNGANNITINTGGKTIEINAFIHAPQSTLTINGGGTVNINGAVWVNNFANNGATVNISPDLIARLPTPEDLSTSVRAYKLYSTTDEFYGGTSEMTNRPLTGSPTNWKTEEVN